MVTQKFAAFIIALLFISTPLRAEVGKEGSVLLPPPAAAFVFEPDKISIQARWRLAIHGLRLAALDPGVWGIVRRDKTDNRRLVPIRPFFLRSSENPNYRVKSVGITFSFRKVDPHYMEKVPYLKDSLLEINFHGAYKAGSDSPLPLVDRSTLLRLSAFPPLPSGFFTREGTKLTQIADAAIPSLKTGIEYRALLEVGSNSAVLNVDGVRIGEIHGENLDLGLISIMSGWNPLSVKSLEIKGTMQEGSKLREIQQSGLLDSARLKLG